MYKAKSLKIIICTKWSLDRSSYGLVGLGDLNDFLTISLFLVIQFNLPSFQKALQLCAIVVMLMVTSTGHAQTKFKSLNFLYEISGKKTVGGIHNREPNAEPARWTNYIHETTGNYPALWSGDFLFQKENMDNRWTMIFEAERQWNKGALINIMWHGCPPDQGEPCEWDPGLLNAQLDDDQWEEIITDGTPLNKIWKTRMDEISVYLYYLKEKGVEVLFRPLHEMNQGKFWWGGRPGPKGTAELYRITRDYMEKEKGLDNLIWVWDMQDMSWDFEDYNPGQEYWDVFAFDVYERGFDKEWYDYILPIVGDKPMAIGECSKLPSVKMLKEQPRWTFFMPWSELVKSSNTEKEIIKLYNDKRVIMLEDMPGWNSNK